MTSLYWTRAGSKKERIWNEFDMKSVVAHPWMMEGLEIVWKLWGCVSALGRNIISFHLTVDRFLFH